MNLLLTKFRRGGKTPLLYKEFIMYNTEDIFDWSLKEAVEIIETSVEQDLEDCNNLQKQEYINLLKLKLDNLIPTRGD